MYKYLFLFILSFGLFACSGKADSEESQYSDIATGELFELYEQSSSEKVFYDEQDDYVVGSVQDVQFQDGRVYLIDDGDTKLLVLSEDGVLIQQVGRSGRGPGEYERPTSLGVSDGELLLLDQGLNRITRYSSDGESAELTPEKSGSHEMSMSDICTADGEIWIYSAREGNTIHQIDGDLESTSISFGESYETGDVVQEDIASDGIIACGEQYIVAGFVSDNIVRIYDKKDGSLQKEIAFDEIIPVNISVKNRDGQQALARNYYPGEAYDEKGDYHDNLQNIVIVDNHLLVQYERSFSDAESDRQHIISLNVNADSGTYAMSKDLPLIYDYKDGKFVSGSNDPLPHIEINSISD